MVEVFYPLPDGSLTTEIEVEVNLLSTVSRPFCLRVRRPSGTRDQFFFLLEISFGQLRVYYFVAPLWREGGSVICCTIATGPCQSSHSWAEVPQNSWPYFTLSSETPPTWRARFPYLYSPRNRWPSSTLEHWVPCLSPFTTRRATVEVFYPASTRDN
jgi:hypothetical protein